ncbi:MAG: aminotransferase class IV [Clostridiaceae bacterium]
MDKLVGNYFVKNKNILEKEEFSYTLCPSNVYEVIRVIDRTPLFLEEHLKRLDESLALSGITAPKSGEEIKNLMIRLIKKNQIKNGNIKLLINKDNATDLYLYFIPHNYPEMKLYRDGITVASINIERKNPNAKVIDENYKKAVSSFIEERDIYEALLVNREGFFTEGSKSNVFFVMNGVLITPPLKDVLGGVTRKRILALAKENNVKTLEKSIRPEEVKTLEGAFISGTSPKILPISSIDGIRLKSTECDIIKSLIRLYDEKIRDYVAMNATL